MPHSQMPRGLIALAGGAAAPLAFSPFNLWWLMPLAMAAPMMLWQQDSPRRGFLHGWLFGFAMFGIGLSWIRISIGIYGNIHAFPALAISLALAAFLALYPAIVGALASHGRKLGLSPRQLQLAWIPSLWTMAEWLRARCFGGFGWLSPGYSQVDSPLAGLLPLGGTLAASAALAVSAGLVALAVQQPRHKWLSLGWLLAIWLGALAASPLQWTEAEGRAHSVALVQGAIPQELKWDPEYLQGTKDLYRLLSEPLWGRADLVVWPEAVIPAFQHQIQDYLGELEARRQGSALMLGLPTYDRETGKLHNSMITMGGNATQHGLPGPGQAYHKQHLVPFGEYLPFAGLLKPAFRKLNIPYSEFSSGGNGVAWLPSPMGPAGIMICYEVIFPHSVLDKLPQAKVLVNVSNDAWFGDSMGPHQHLQIARGRARETGRFLLRATNNGISAIIDPHARLLAKSRQFRSEVTTGEVTAMTGATPYVAYGDKPLLALALVLMAALLWRARRQPDDLWRAA